MNKVFLGTIVMLLVFSTVALAQVEQPQQITLQGTALFTKDSTSGSTLQRATQSGGLLVGYSYQFNNWAGLEGNYGYTRNWQNYFGSFGSPSIQSNIHEVTGSLVLHIPARAGNIHPYALAGGGALIFDPTNQLNGVARQTKGTFVYGGGFNFDVTRNFGVRAEYRGLVYQTPDFTLSNLNLDKVTHLAQPSIGFYFRY